MKNNSFEIITFDDIVIKNSIIPNLKFDQIKLEKVWKNLCEKKNNKLFNDKVLIYVDSFKENNTLCKIRFIRIT
mgnify:CR=1 FL=1